MDDLDGSAASVSAGMNLALAFVSPVLTPELLWRWAFPGEERQLGVLRRWIALLLPACESRDDITSVATELASNTLRHTESGAPERQFAVGLAWCRRFVHVAVAGHGAAGGPRIPGDLAAEHGRGMRIVGNLSMRSGMHGGQTGRVTWADVVWSGPPPAELSEDDKDASEPAVLPGTPARHRQRTLQWWTAAAGHFAVLSAAQFIAGPGITPGSAPGVPAGLRAGLAGVDSAWRL
ncbi:MAG TPA: hypothetical protein VFQ44_07545 [Streptosporangiaceae bacterium]|nr:hypothetical protein [Streptosporangiaceae bacterium]